MNGGFLLWMCLWAREQWRSYCPVSGHRWHQREAEPPTEKARTLWLSAAAVTREHARSCTYTEHWTTSVWEFWVTPAESHDWILAWIKESHGRVRNVGNDGAAGLIAAVTGSCETPYDIYIVPSVCVCYSYPFISWHLTGLRSVKWSADCSVSIFTDVFLLLSAKRSCVWLLIWD